MTEENKSIYFKRVESNRLLNETTYFKMTDNQLIVVHERYITGESKKKYRDFSVAVSSIQRDEMLEEAALMPGTSVITKDEFGQILSMIKSDVYTLILQEEKGDPQGA